MTWTKKHTVLVGVLVLGGSAVAADQLFLRPGTAEAPAAAAALVAASTPAEAEAPKPRAAHAAAPPLVARLNRLLGSFEYPASPEQLDALSIPTAWETHPAPAHATGSENAAAPGAAAPQIEPAPEFRLSLIKRSGGVPTAAVINNRLVALGAAIDGYTLVALSGSTGRAGSNHTLAVLEGPAGRVEVTLEHPISRVAHAE